MLVYFCQKKVFAALSVGLLLTLSGCGSQVAHHSGQIGRYYGEGVYFSVPVLQEAADVLREDKFWEIRQGIGGADVVVLGPFITQDSAESFRENMVLSSRPIEGISKVEQFREQQLDVLRREFPKAGQFAEGMDYTGCWETFEYEQDGRQLACKAWFYIDDAHSRGYTLVGTVQKSSKLAEYYADFNKIAVTFQIGAPYSSFSGMSKVLAKAVEAAVQDEGRLTAPIKVSGDAKSGVSATQKS